MQTKDNEFRAPGAVASARIDGTAIDFSLEGGGLLHLDFLSPHVVRVRVAADGRLAEPPAIRHGFARDRLSPEQGACGPEDLSVSEDEVGITIRSPGIAIRVNRFPLRLSFLAPDGSLLTQGATPWSNLWSGGASLGVGSRPAVCLEMADDEHFYGLGFHRSNLDCRGRSLEWTRSFRHRGATVPFFLSSRGYGFLSNNTWKHVFDFSVTETPSGGYTTVTADGGALDFFFIHGPAFRDVLRRYTDLAGLPALPPRYATGLLYICRYFETQEGVLAIADAFRRHDIPCDMIGLEPGWEEVPYAMEWRWSPERFPDPAAMIRGLRDRGFALELWESGDAPTADYADPDVRARWFAKRVSASLDLGVAFFKQDDPYPRMITSQELQTPELGRPLDSSGELSAGEYLNVTNSLFSETLIEEFRRRTGRRTMVIFNGYTVSLGSHRWPAAWAADYAAGTGLLNASLSAHSMVCMDMRNGTPAGIHLGFLIPFSIIDAWAYYIEPWIYPPHLLECHRFYAKLRHRLAPYLYSSLHQACESGVPSLRPMVLDHQNEPFARELATQHMLGDWLLVGHEPAVFLPKGTWIDYFTNQRHVSSGQWLECTPPEPAGGPLFVKAGALIPTKPVAPFIGAEPDDLVILHAYPGEEPSSYLLCEDDGTSYAYQDGARATTAFHFETADRATQLKIGARTGSYEGMPAGRTYLVCVHLAPTAPVPKGVTSNGTPLARERSRDALLLRGDGAGFWHDEARGELWVKPEVGWRMGPDARGPGGDPEQDSMVWTAANHPGGNAIEIEVRLAASRAAAVARDPPRAQTPVLPADRLHVAATPPERIALRHGDWLPRRASFWVTLMSGDAPAHGVEARIRMEVLDASSAVTRTEERDTVRGRVRFGGVEYREGEWRFRFSSPGLPAAETTIGPAPVVPGRMG